MADAVPYVEPPQYGPGGAAPIERKSPVRTAKQLVQYHDIPIATLTSWDVTSAQNAINQHRLGNFYASALLAEDMMSDDAYDSVINTRILGLVGREKKIKPPAQLRKDERAKEAAAAISESWDDIFPEETQNNLLAWAHNMGFAIGQLVWRYEDGMWKPRVQPWHPANIYYRVDTRTFVANTLEGPAHIFPGEGNWFLYTPYGAYRGWMRGAVRSCWVPYLARQYAIRDWARYNEVHGLPIKKLKYPQGYDADDVASIVQSISNLGNETLVPLPQAIDKNSGESFDLDLLEAKADTWEAFEGLMSKCESRFAIRMLGQNLTTEVDAGSLAAANVHDRVRLDYIRGDAKTFGAQIAEQILAPFCAFNYGDIDITPTPVWNTKPPEDAQVQARALAEVSVALQNFAMAGAPIDQRALLRQSGIPLLPDGVKPPPPPDPGERPENPGGGGGGKATARLDVRKSHALAGQVYTDNVIDNASRASLRAMAPHLKSVMAAIDGAKSYSELRRRLKVALNGANQKRLAKVMERALVMTELAGRHAILSETR